MMPNTLDDALILACRELAFLHDTLEAHQGELAGTPSGRELMDVVAVAWITVQRTRAEREADAPPNEHAALHSAIERLRASDT